MIRSSAGKLLLFSEFADTADYLYERLTAAGIEGVERIDSRVAGKEAWPSFATSAPITTMRAPRSSRPPATAKSACLSARMSWPRA